MTIAKGRPWGAVVTRPADLRIAADDAELAAMLSDGTGRPTAVANGDVMRTLGATPVGDRSELNAFPIDLLDVKIDGGEPIPAIAHVVAHRPAENGGRWRGEVLAVMNAEFLGDFDVAPRGHPNDGRVDCLRLDPDMTLRQRLAVRTRLRNASHLPHPLITVRSVRAAEYDFESRMRIVVDARPFATATHLSVTVRPDAAVLYA